MMVPFPSTHDPFFTAKKPPTICKDKKEVVQCSSSGGKRSVCIVPKAELVLNVDPKSLSSNCVAGKTYGRHGDEIWVSGKCGGKFDVCYREGTLQFDIFIFPYMNIQ